MCVRPITLEDGTVCACRKCDQCLSTRLQTWVARAMAEKAVTPHTFAITLTYADDTDAKRTAAHSFRYSDVRNFMRNIRGRIEEKYGETGAIRFICCGERGSKKGRVHWHIILFCQRDPFQFGTFRRWGHRWFGNIFSGRGKKNKIRLDWDLWPHGYIQIEKPTDHTMAYVLKYAFKDQMSAERSKNDARLATSERQAASYFRMSKRPAIGEPWLYAHLSELAAKDQMPINLNFKVPDYWGYWHPSGQTRANVLDYLKNLVSRIEDATGRKPRQYAAFHSSLNFELERSRFDGTEQKQEEEDYTRRKRDRQHARREQEQRGRINAVKRRCGHLYPCKDCTALLDNSEFANLEEWVAQKIGCNSDGEPYTSGEAFDETQAEFAEENRINPWCQFRDVFAWAFNDASLDGYYERGTRQKALQSKAGREQK